MEKSRILHLQSLIDKGACANQVALFKRKFGKSAWRGLPWTHQAL